MTPKKDCPADHTSPEWEHAYRIKKVYCQQCGDWIGYEPLCEDGDWQSGFSLNKPSKAPERPQETQHTFEWRNDPREYDDDMP